MAQQEGADILSLAAPIAHCGFPQSHQITHCLTGRIRGPGFRQLARPQQAVQAPGIPTIGRHAIIGAAGDQRRGDDGASMSERLDQALQALAGRSHLITELQPDARVGWASFFASRRTDVSSEPISPIYRTSPFRPPSATAWLSLETSRPTKMVLCACMVRPPGMRTGPWSNPRSNAASVGRTAHHPRASKGHTGLPMNRRAAKRKPPVARASLPAGRPRTPDQGLRRIRQSPPVPRKPEQPAGVRSGLLSCFNKLVGSHALATAERSSPAGCHPSDMALRQSRTNCGALRVSAPRKSISSWFRALPSGIVPVALRIKLLRMRDSSIALISG